MTSDDDPDMTEELMWVRRPRGTHLSQSHTDPGNFSPLARANDTNDLQGQATMRPADEELLYGDGPMYFDDPPTEDSQDASSEELAAALIMLGAVYAMNEVAPRITKWWETRGREAALRAFRRLKPKRRSKGSQDARNRAGLESTSGEPDVVLGVPILESAQAPTAIEVYRTGMPSDEARERFISALVAQAYAEEQLRILRSARIEDGSPSRHLAVPLESLTPDQLSDGIRRVLEAHPEGPSVTVLDHLGEVVEKGPSMQAPLRQRLRVPQVPRFNIRRD